MSKANIDIDEHPWSLLGRRLRMPFKQWSFWIVLILGIGVFGYLAVWIEEHHIADFVPTKERPTPDLEPLRLAYATAILAVAAPCIAQLVLAMNKMAGLVGLVITTVVGALAYWVSESTSNLGAIHSFGLPGLLIAAFAWWLANGEDQLFQDRPNSQASSGGPDPMGQLPGGNSGLTI